MKFFIVILALAILAFSAFVAATPANRIPSEVRSVRSANDNQKRGEGSSRVRSANDNQKRGEGSSRVRSVNDNQKRDETSTSNLLDKKAKFSQFAPGKCPSNHHWCYDADGGCCPNNKACVKPYACA